MHSRDSRSGGKDAPTRRTTVRRWLTWCVVAAGLCTAAAVTLELTLEARDAAAARSVSRMARIGNANVRYELIGSGAERPLVVLLNGFAGTLEQWRFAAPFLTPEFRVLRYDRGGMGYSDASTFRLRDQVSELLGLLDTLGEHRPVLLVGYSTAAETVRLFMTQHPERVAGSILLAPYLPEIQTVGIVGLHGSVRNLSRVILTSLVCSGLGIYRLREVLRPVQSDNAEFRRSAVLLRRYWHWRAVLGELIAQSETDSLLLHGPRLTRPAVLLEEQLPAESDTSFVRGYRQSIAKFLATGDSLRLVPLPAIPHSQQVEDSSALQVLKDALLSLPRCAPDCARSSPHAATAPIRQ